MVHHGAIFWPSTLVHQPITSHANVSKDARGEHDVDVGSIKQMSEWMLWCVGCDGRKT